jgi:hypothetical protein
VCNEISEELCPPLNSTLEKGAPSRMNNSETKTGETFSMAMSDEFSVNSNAASLLASYSSGPWLFRPRFKTFLN